MQLVYRYSLGFYPFPLYYCCNFWLLMHSFHVITGYVLHEVQLTDQQRFKQIFYDFKAKMEVF